MNLINNLFRRTFTKRTIILIIVLMVLAITVYYKGEKKYEYIFFEFKNELSRPACNVNGAIYVQIVKKIENKPDKVNKPPVRLDTCRYLYYKDEIYMVYENVILLQKDGKDMIWHFEDNIEKKLMLLLNERLGQKSSEQ